MTYDVIILGLGAMGSATAYHLASRGKRVLGLEKFGAAHSFGSSHGDSRIIRQAYHEHPNYVPLVLRSYDLWRALERDSGEHILIETGGLMIGAPDSGIVKGAVLSAALHNLPYELLDATEIRKRYPALYPRPHDVAVFEPAAGYVRPEVAINAHLTLAQHLGADLRFNECVESWNVDESGNLVTVRTAAATFTAERLVIAPGAWAPELLSTIGVPFDIRRHVMCWFKPLANPSFFSQTSLPIYIWDVDGTNCFYGFPFTGSESDGVKAAMHNGGQRCRADTVNRTVSEADINELYGHLAPFIPGLSGSAIRAFVCMYTLTPDEHFVVSLHPHYPQVAIAVGFSGHGFKFSPVIGEILADLATLGTTPHAIEFLSPRRFTIPNPNIG